MCHDYPILNRRCSICRVPCSNNRSGPNLCFDCECRKPDDSKEESNNGFNSGGGWFNSPYGRG